MREYRIQEAPSSRKNRVGAHVWVDSGGRIASYNGGCPPPDMFGLRCTDCAGDLTAGAYRLRPVEHYPKERVQVGAPSQRWYPPMPSPVRGYAVQAEAGSAPTVIHSTQEQAEAEALRLAACYTGTRFYVHPVFTGHALSVASIPKPTATLERL